MGVAFTIVSLLVARFAPAGEIWWFWMLIPAFSLMGKGIAQYIRLKDKEQRGEFVPRVPAAQVTPSQAVPGTLPRRTDELRPPVPSVTEGTTRHLGVEAPTRHLETHEPK